jgi:methionyl aminopeptidase
MWLGIEVVKPAPIWATWRRDQKRAGRTVTAWYAEFCGPGIGRKFHEIPGAALWPRQHRRCAAGGVIFTIEPMINAGKPAIRSPTVGP